MNMTMKLSPFKNPVGRINYSAAVVMYVFAAAALLVTSSGCQVFTPAKAWKWPWEEKNDEPKLPDRIMPIWTDTILHQPGQPGIRGFGGRIYFYAGEDTDAVEVDGGLVVYIFDSENMDPHSPEPEKKYVFTPDQFKSHLSQAPMGKSYSVWLPWDEVGGESRSLTLVTRFEGRNGGVILSQPAVKFLPGVSRPKKENADGKTTSEASGNVANQQHANQQHDSGVQLATYQANEGSSVGEKTADKKPNPKRRETQTIDLPPSFHRHINAPPGSPLADPFSDKRETAASEAKAKSTDSTNSDSAVPSQEKAQAEGTVKPASHGEGVGGLLRYPFRYVPGMTPAKSGEVVTTEGAMETTISKTRPTRREPTKGGWIESLPRTPR